MVADNDVANGFVKDGSSLPYVFEADESGKFFMTYLVAYARRYGGQIV